MRKASVRAIGLGAVLVLCAALVAGLGIAQAANGSAAASPLQQACGSKVVIQTDWFPEPEHGAVYQLAGTKGKLDAKKGRYTGTIGNTGVSVEIRSGGPFTGFQQPISQMYQDSGITMGYVTSDEAVQLSKKLPTVAIVTPLEFSPQIVMWNPAELKINRWPDVAKADAKVLVFEGGVWVDYLVAKGYVKQDQVDTSYDGSPTRFVTSNGKIVQQGFVTSEPFKYENEIKEWMKPVKFLLIKDAGYTPYPQALATKPETLKAKRACFKQLVPLIQKAQVDYVKNPGPVNAKLLDITTKMKTFWVLTPAGNANNVKKQLKYGIVQNGPNCTLGDFSNARTQKLINTLKPIYKAKGIDTYNPNLRASQIQTNEFINPKIGIKTAKCK